MLSSSAPAGRGGEAWFLPILIIPPSHQSESAGSIFERKTAVEVELQSERTATLLRVKTADLSLGGLYVEMMFTLEVGTKLRIVLWINDVKVSTGGIVATRDLQVGNGMEFTDMATEDRLRLKRFLAAADDAQSPK